jgi:hypothetical protein
MFNRFSGISHREYGIRVGQAGQGSVAPGVHHPTAARPGTSAWTNTGSKGPSLGTTFTQPLCLCKLQREADAKKGK